ncbi:MAG: hypothetical protein MAG795_01271 [Candidatus Woesearchaeota archaeon]|nr:hypothetical protein [Candidatus Woesearchaeota archaeon]
MSRAAKHVKWCLKKSKQELEECRRQGKNPKHRGLIKINPSVKSAEEHIAKAEHYLKAIFRVKDDFSDIAVSHAFYSLYQCFLAIAAKFGYESANQQCTISLIEWLKEEEKISLDNEKVAQRLIPTLKCRVLTPLFLTTTFSDLKITH